MQIPIPTLSLIVWSSTDSRSFSERSPGKLFFKILLFRVKINLHQTTIWNILWWLKMENGTWFQILIKSPTLLFAKCIYTIAKTRSKTIYEEKCCLVNITITNMDWIKVFIPEITWDLHWKSIYLKSIQKALVGMNLGLIASSRFLIQKDSLMLSWNAKAKRLPRI